MSVAVHFGLDSLRRSPSLEEADFLSLCRHWHCSSSFRDVTMWDFPCPCCHLNIMLVLFRYPHRWGSCAQLPSHASGALCSSLVLWLLQTFCSVSCAVPWAQAGRYGVDLSMELGTHSHLFSAFDQCGSVAKWCFFDKGWEPHLNFVFLSHSVFYPRTLPICPGFLKTGAKRTASETQLLGWNPVFN